MPGDHVSNAPCKTSPVQRDEVQLVSAVGAVTSAQLVMTGEADFVAVPEPIATMMVKMSHQHERTNNLYHALNVGQAWDQQYPQGPGLLLSHIISVEAKDEVKQLFIDQYPYYVEKCRTQPEHAATLFNHHFPVMSQPSLQHFLTTAPMEITPTDQKQQQLQQFIDMMEKIADEAL